MENRDFEISAKRSLQAQQQQQAFMDMLINNFPGVPCSTTVTGHGHTQLPDGKVIPMVKVMLMLPTGPVIVGMEPQLAMNLADNLKSHALQAQSGLEIVENGSH